MKPKTNDEITKELIKEKDIFILRYLQAMEFGDARLMEDYDIAFNKKLEEALEAKDRQHDIAIKKILDYLKYIKCPQDRVAVESKILANLKSNK